MADEIKFGYITGRTLTYGVYQPDGTVRTAAGTALPEEGATGYYHADNGDIEAGDFVVIIDGGTFVCGQGEYKPEVSTPEVLADIAAMDAKVDIIDTNVDSLLTGQQTVYSKNELPVEPEGKVIKY